MGPTFYDDDDDESLKDDKIYGSQQISNESIINIPNSSTSIINTKSTATKRLNLNDFMSYKSLDNKICNLSSKIESLSKKLNYTKSQELFRSLESARHFTDYPKYLSSIKDYIGEDDDTESSSDDSYSQIEGGNINANESNGQRKLYKHQSWLVLRCQFHAKWSWLLSEIQSTEFRLKHLKKYSDELKYLKRKFTFKNDINVEESARSRYMKLEKRRRVQIHNLLSPDLIKFVSPLYSNDDNSSDKFVQCRCKLGDTGPCILCCGMKNKTLESSFEFLDEEDMWKASLLDNSIHKKLSNISDVRNQVKRNVLFNGYVKTNDSHWSYPRARTSFSPILSTPSQPKTDVTSKINPLSLEFSGFNSSNREYKADIANDLFQMTKSESPIEDSCIEKFEIKLPYWQSIKQIEQRNFDEVKEEEEEEAMEQCILPLRETSKSHQHSMRQSEEDTRDEAYVRRHVYEEAIERRRNYPLLKGTAAHFNPVDRIRYFHGFEYKPNVEYGFDLRLFPLPSDDEKQLSSFFNISSQRTKRFKKKFSAF